MMSINIDVSVKDAQLQRKYPGTPWKWREDWSSGKISGTNKTNMVFFTFSAVFWNAISWGLFLAFNSDPGKENVSYFMLIFCAIGLLLLVKAVRLILVWKRFGASVLELTTIPGVIGGTLQGMLKCRLKALPEKPVLLTLTCIHRRTTRKKVSRAGQSDTTTDDIKLWKVDTSVDPRRIKKEANGISIPVFFAIPSNKKPSDDTDRNNIIWWRLNIHANIPGVDYKEEFEVPVFITPDSPR
ncbi:MAG: hypothetical protein GY757_23760 [bacterium]|nr:hypothetical protein [bacterium]